MPIRYLLVLCALSLASSAHVVGERSLLPRPTEALLSSIQTREQYRGHGKHRPNIAVSDEIQGITTLMRLSGGGINREKDMGRVVDAKGESRSNTIKVISFFGLWYILNVWYNIVNKKVLNALPLPMSVAVFQLGIGSLWVGLQWALGIREGVGALNGKVVRRIAPVAFFHGGGQLATVISLGAGAVSFTHVVKAMEPFFSALVAAVCFGQIFRLQVYAALLPVVAGVSLACYTEINFNWVSFLGAMASNLLFALRANFSKSLMNRPPTVGPLSSANLYGIVTVMSFFLLSPVVFGVGLPLWKPTLQKALDNGYTQGQLATNLLLSGISHYLNNEVMYLALGNVHPTTLAVGNTMKRVFIIVASLVVFHTPISRMGALGSTIGILGVLVYTLTKQHYDAIDSKIKKSPQQG
ncbi:unnamed protein product [Choristocarpus tenellus]